ncbi:unnamed protein product [Sphagnum compactum]
MMEAYKELEEKLQNFMDDQIAIESSYKDLKAELRKKERELKGQHEEISDLQIQLTFKDIRGMVEHNSQLRTLVRSLAQQNEQKEHELKV